MVKGTAVNPLGTRRLVLSGGGSEGGERRGILVEKHKGTRGGVRDRERE